MVPMLRIDDIDRSIIVELQADGRKPLREVARNLDIAEATVRLRLKRLQDEGIMQFVAFADPTKLGRSVMALLLIAASPDAHESVVSQLQNRSEISYLSTTLGDTDIRAQVVCPDDAALGVLRQQVRRLGGVQSVQVLSEIDESKIPNLAGMHPRVADLDKFVKVDRKRYAVPFTFSSIPLMYNPDMVPEPTSWLDLLKPEYKGKVAGYPDVMSMIVTWSKTANGLDEPSRMTKAQLHATVDLMIKLKQNSRTVPASLGEIFDVFKRGEIAMGMGWEPMVKWMEGSNVKLKIASPKEGTFAYFDTVNIGKDAPNRDLDHEFINWALAPENQKAFAEANILGIVNEKAMGMVADKVTSEIYGFADLNSYFANKFLPGMFPLEAEGDLVKWDDVLAAYETYQRA